MIGSYMNGRRTWQGKQTAYDAGTGVIPEYRGRGVAKELFAFMVPRLKEVWVAQYLLEVLSENELAVALYRKLGFVETRVLAVFRSGEPVKRFGVLPDVSIRPVEEPDWGLFESFWDGYPSWQNSARRLSELRTARNLGSVHGQEMCGLWRRVSTDRKSDATGRSA